MDSHTVKTKSRQLLTPIRVGQVTLPNRIAVSPMCMYASTDGYAADFHLAHLGRFAMGGAGLVIAEATAITPQGRISPYDLGIWEDDHIAGLQRVSNIIKSQGSIPGIQLSHAGRRAAVKEPWFAGAPLTEEDDYPHPPWPIVGPSPLAVGPGHQVPQKLTNKQALQLITQFQQAAERAVKAGFEVIELHGAHGYLLHSFLSPLANVRDDHWGGDEERRMAFPLKVIKAVRKTIGDRALFYRISAVDGYRDGLNLDTTTRFALAAYEAGVDLIDVSSGGVSTDRSTDSRVRRTYSFHADFSQHIKEQTGQPVATVGLIVDPEQAAQHIERGEADVVLLGREMLDNPNWARRAYVELGAEDTGPGATRITWPLEPRRRLFSKLAADGETPLTRFNNEPLDGK